MGGGCHIGIYLRRLAGVVFLCLAAVSRPAEVCAQRIVSPCTEWVASVDEATQQIVLRWRPSADLAAAGYHICTGDTCREYAIVRGRMDTSYTCMGHSPLARHVYRLHVFDSSGNTSTLTPPFGNMVLEAEVPPCDTRVSARWSPYTGMPSGLGGYVLYVRLLPGDDDYVPVYSSDSLGALDYSFEIPEGAVQAGLKVCATSRDGRLVAVSNVVSVQRRTADTAAFVRVGAAVVDSIGWRVSLPLDTDTTFHGGQYTLWRSRGDGIWTPSATFAALPSSFTDTDIRPYADTLLCYRLSVLDGCGLNPKYSAERCVRIPRPPAPSCSIPNAVIVGDGGVNECFRPSVAGMSGDGYSLTVYDRMGRQVFRTADASEGWRPGRETPQGAYTYRLHVRYLDATEQTYAGTVVVIK